MSAEKKGKVIEIPVVQLPVDLQNEIRGGGGSIASGAFVGGARDFLMMLLLLIAAAAFAYGFASAFGNLRGPFHSPFRLLFLAGGAATVGVFLGLHARLDIRPHNISRWIVGPTSLVRVGRDVIEVFPAEDIVHDGVNVSFGNAVLERGYHVPSDELAAAAKASADPAARASDRWRAAAVGRPAPVWRWAPLAHGAGLALALAVAVEAGIPSSGGADRWPDLNDRADKIAEKIPAYDTGIALQRIDDAARDGGIAGVEQLIHTAKNQTVTDVRLAELAEKRREAMIEEALPNAPLDVLYYWYSTGKRDLALPDALDRKIRTQFQVVLARDYGGFDIDTLIALAQEAYEMQVSRTEALAEIDRKLAKGIGDTAKQPIDETVMGQLPRIVRDLGLDGVAKLPLTAKAAGVRAAAFVQTATTMEQVATVSDYLPEAQAKAAFQRAYERELAASTLETVGTLFYAVHDYGTGSQEAVQARAQALLAVALANMRTADELDKLVETSSSLPLEHQPVLDQITARGKVLARSAGTLTDQIKWTIWLADDEAAKPMRARIEQLAKSGDLGAARDIAMLYDDNDVRTAAQTRLDEACEKMFPSDKRGKDLARWIAATMCNSVEPVIGVSQYDIDGANDLARQYLARAQAILSNAGVNRTLRFEPDTDTGVVLYVRKDYDGKILVQASKVDPAEDFECKNGGGRWSCSLPSAEAQ